MYKIILLIITAYSLAFPAFKTEMPVCVQKIVDNYVKDSTGEDGFIKVKQIFSFVDNSIKSNEIEADIPIKEYMFDYNKLDTCADSTPVEELIKPTGRWIFPVKAHGRFIYEVNIRITKEGCHTAGCSSLNNDLFWGDLRIKYPSSQDINPVLVIDGESKYLHFPKKGSHNLYFLDPKNFSESSASHNISTLNDGRKLIASIQKAYRDKKSFRDEIEIKHPGILDKLNRGGEE
jgi:hypothetical protein